MSKVIAVYGISNNAVVNVYEIEHDITDRILVGINDEPPEWTDIDDVNTTFTIGTMEISLDECIRI